MNKSTRTPIYGTVLFAMLSGSALAAPVGIALNGVSLEQPNGRGNAVITYRLDEAPVIVTVDVQTNTLDNGAGEWVSLGGGLVKRLTGDIGIVRRTGRCTIKWNSTKDWPEQVVETGRIRATVTAWATNAPPDWMVIGLKKPNDVRFYAESNHVPEGVASDVYKSEKMLMRRVPAAGAIWTMGLTADQGTAVADDTIPRRVMLSKDYFVGVYEVTQCQYTNMGMTAAAGFSSYSDSWKRPACKLNMVDVRGTVNLPNGSYNVTETSACGRLHNISGGKIEFDLPTETQWEFACRAGTQTAYNNGTDYTQPNCDAIAWYGLNSTQETSDGTRQPHPVGTKPPNAFGLYDMNGNIHEMCLDRYVEGSEYSATFVEGYEKGAVTVDPLAANWSSSASLVNRIVTRGGGWNSEMKYCRSGARLPMTSYGASYDTNGFRICCPAVFQ